jgi:Winged helix-turn-helix DNA-binding
MGDPNGSGGSWTLLTGHGHVLVEIARDPESRIRDISIAVGLTERTVQAIVADLEADGYLSRTRHGRRTKYTVNRDSLFRHSAQEGLRVGPLLDLLAAEDGAGDTTEHKSEDKSADDGARDEPRHRPALRRRRR